MMHSAFTLPLVNGRVDRLRGTRPLTIALLAIALVTGVLLNYSLVKSASRKYRATNNVMSQQPLLGREDSPAIDLPSNESEHSDKDKDEAEPFSNSGGADKQEGSSDGSDIYGGQISATVDSSDEEPPSDSRDDKEEPVQDETEKSDEELEQKETRIGEKDENEQSSNEKMKTEAHLSNKGEKQKPVGAKETGNRSKDKEKTLVGDKAEKDKPASAREKKEPQSSDKNKEKTPQVSDRNIEKHLPGEKKPDEKPSLKKRDDKKLANKSEKDEKLPPASEKKEIKKEDKKKLITMATQPTNKKEQDKLSTMDLSSISDKDLQKLLRKTVASSMSESEVSQWYDGSSGSSMSPNKSCPRQQPLPSDWKTSSYSGYEMKEFTPKQASELMAKLKKGSKTIRDAFEPFIDSLGFDLDLILQTGYSIANHGGVFMGVFDGVVHFWDKEGNSEYDKANRVAHQMESALEMLHERGIKVPDVIFPFALSSFPTKTTHSWCSQQSLVPPHLQERYTAAPVAAIAFDPKIHAGIALLPNMYFGNLRAWNEYMDEFLDGGRLDTRWSKRRSRVSWRGKVSANFENNKPRVEALQVAARDAKRRDPLMDIKLTGGCDNLDVLVANETLTSQQSPPWLPKDEFLKITNQRCGSSQYLNHANYTNYRALLNLPGRTAGSYSRNLQSLWPTGAAVMIWEQAAVEFYYDTLEPGVTHVWVNASNIDNITQRALENDGGLARLLGESSRRWFKNHLSADAILDYYVEWFNAWAALQRFTPKPEMLVDPCSCGGWVDTQKGHTGVKRCSWCKSYPRDTKDDYASLTGIQYETTQ